MPKISCASHRPIVPTHKMEYRWRPYYFTVARLTSATNNCFFSLQSRWGNILQISPRIWLALLTAFAKWDDAFKLLLIQTRKSFSVSVNVLFVLQFLEPGTVCHLTWRGERAFRIAVPRVWNSLPSDMKRADTVKTLKRCHVAHLIQGDCVNFLFNISG